MTAFLGLSTRFYSNLCQCTFALFLAGTSSTKFLGSTVEYQLNIRDPKYSMKLADPILSSPQFNATSGAATSNASLGSLQAAFTSRDKCTHQLFTLPNLNEIDRLAGLETGLLRHDTNRESPPDLHA
ncbi:hypothetical protein C0995_012135 [Termitomyces sp. Mi166|nr:hypothetical protein C0995_012135 [Termitomyces sp. Mi166\